MFVGNYTLSFLLLILGLKAPGIMTAREYFSLNNSSDLFFDVSFPLVLNYLDFYLVIITDIILFLCLLHLDYYYCRV